MLGQNSYKIKVMKYISNKMVFLNYEYVFFCSNILITILEFNSKIGSFDNVIRFSDIFNDRKIWTLAFGLFFYTNHI